MKYPITPDGRYFVVRGRLWRMSDPSLSPDRLTELKKQLMAARRDVETSKRAGDDEAKRAARRRVDAAKRELGERGPPWWNDGEPDMNRRMAKNTPYADWFDGLNKMVL